MAAVTALLAALWLAVCQWLIYAYAPVEATLGLSQKIFYLHMPLAWWSLLSFFLVFAASGLYLARRLAFWDHVARAAAETGVLFCGLTLITGAIWGKLAWGVWWTWDPRLTTTLVMLFIYAGYLAARQLDASPEKRRQICAVIGLVAFLDVPLVFFSARLFRSIHPAVFGGGGGMEPEMLLTLAACVIGLGLYWLALLACRIGQLRQAARLGRLRIALLAAETGPAPTKS